MTTKKGQRRISDDLWHSGHLTSCRGCDGHSVINNSLEQGVGMTAGITQNGATQTKRSKEMDYFFTPPGKILAFSSSNIYPGIPEAKGGGGMVRGEWGKRRVERRCQWKHRPSGLVSQ